MTLNETKSWYFSKISEKPQTTTGKLAPQACVAKGKCHIQLLQKLRIIISYKIWLWMKQNLNNIQTFQKILRLQQKNSHQSPLSLRVSVICKCYTNYEWWSLIQNDFEWNKILIIHFKNFSNTSDSKTGTKGKTGDSNTGTKGLCRTNGLCH